MRTKLTPQAKAFACDLDLIIRRHLPHPQWGDDFLPLLDALVAAECRLEFAADRYPWRDDEIEAA